MRELRTLQSLTLVITCGAYLQRVGCAQSDVYRCNALLCPAREDETLPVGGYLWQISCDSHELFTSPLYTQSV